MPFRKTDICADNNQNSSVRNQTIFNKTTSSTIPKRKFSRAWSDEENMRFLTFLIMYK